MYLLQPMASTSMQMLQPTWSSLSTMHLSCQRRLECETIDLSPLLRHMARKSFTQNALTRSFSKILQQHSKFKNYGGLHSLTGGQSKLAKIPDRYRYQIPRCSEFALAYRYFTSSTSYLQAWMKLLRMLLPRSFSTWNQLNQPLDSLSINLAFPHIFRYLSAETR